MMIKSVENVVAITPKPKMLKRRKIISPKTMPIDMKIACLNPEPRAFEMIAKVPGPGVAINIKITPTNVSVAKKSKN